eukprot:Rhum_TRINITY_DN14848_c18_g1::Rhum_TRINITY_DN14848_c18_g1_i1::g.122781::m.122781
MCVCFSQRLGDTGLPPPLPDDTRWHAMTPLTSGLRFAAEVIAASVATAASVTGEGGLREASRSRPDTFSGVRSPELGSMEPMLDARFAARGGVAGDVCTDDGGVPCAAFSSHSLNSTLLVNPKKCFAWYSCFGSTLPDDTDFDRSRRCRLGAAAAAAAAASSAAALRCASAFCCSKSCLRARTSSSSACRAALSAARSARIAATSAANASTCFNTCGAGGAAAADATGVAAAAAGIAGIANGRPPTPPPPPPIAAAAAAANGGGIAAAAPPPPTAAPPPKNRAASAIISGIDGCFCSAAAAAPAPSVRAFAAGAAAPRRQCRRTPCSVQRAAGADSEKSLITRGAAVARRLPSSVSSAGQCHVPAARGSFARQLIQ